jgi:hypothetical protein
MVIRDALVSFLQREPLRPIEPSDEGHSDEATQAVLRQDKLEAVLMACAHFSENTSEVLRMELLAENVIFAHHPLIGNLIRPLYIINGSCERCHRFTVTAGLDWARAEGRH